MSMMETRERLAMPTEAVVRAVATVRGVDPTDLRTPLFEVIDPDALDRLFESPADDLTVSFQYHGHDVTLTADLTVVVDETVVEPER